MQKEPLHERSKLWYVSRFRGIEENPMRALWIVIWLVSFAYAAPLSKAYYAGGCFWGVEYHLEKLIGVKEVRSGYMGGNIKSPTYQGLSWRYWAFGIGRSNL